ncbi:ATP-binding cassette domain-containing protein [Leptolyngbya sp. AN02str]|uniref:ATP-binding cassette domain-containing protein n=1 Tax=Leptolyngbya sp. AN02str TaxID=3423363 RepID=UPI003D314C68
MPSIWHLLVQMLRYAPRLYAVDTLLWLLILGLPAVPGLLIREFFDSLTQEAGVVGSPWMWIGLLLATGLARVVAILLGRVTKTQHRFLMSGLVRHNLLLELLQRPGAEVASGGINGQKTSPGELLSYFRDDALQIEDTVVGTNELFAAGVFALGSVVVLLSVAPKMTLLAFLPLCAIAALAHQAEHRLKRYRHASRQATQQVTGLIGELFTAVQAVKVAGAEARMLEELRRRSDRRRQLMVRDQVFTTTLNSGFENIVSLGTGLLLLLASQSLGRQGTLTVGDFALFVYYLSFVTHFLGFLGGFLATIKQSEVSFERMAELAPQNKNLDPARTLHPLTQPHPLYLKPILGAPPSLPQPQAPTHVSPLQEFRVEGLTYCYPGTQNGIFEVSLTVPRGSLTVITGRVGAGKTTLLRSLLGLLPHQSGQIFWNNQPISDPANFLIPPHAAYTPQIPQLFSTSLQENLLLGLEVESTQTVMQRAIATAVFDRDLAAMPDGLDTRIGTRGVRLSGGQKYRAAAARMLLRQPQLLVFDDLSSALDVETEQQLWAQLFANRHHFVNRHDIDPANDEPIPTCLIVSHRPSILKRADQIILLEAGTVQFSGKPADFLSQFPTFLQESTPC